MTDGLIDRSLIQKYLVGDLPPDQFEQIDAEIDSDTGLQTQLPTLDDSMDSLIQGLKASPVSVPIVQDAAFKRGLELVQAIGREWSRAGKSRASSEEYVSTREVPQVLRDYRILNEIGRGGMGTVYRALHTRLEKVVALKLLPAERLATPDAVSRFEREMRAVGQLEHPNIVRASDAGEHEGHHFLVMEYVDGVDLAALVRACGSLPVAEACELIRQAAMGLQHAHEHGLIHRDLKPSNLLVSKSGTVKLLDLGLARLQDRSSEPDGHLTSSGQIVGTLDYMAPEQFDATRDVEPRTDLYSLGCTLYHLLAGGAPFSGPEYSSIFKVMQAHATNPVPDIRARRDDVPPELQTLMESLLAKDVVDRPASATDVVAALTPLASGADLPTLLSELNFDAMPGVDQSSMPSDSGSRALTDTLIQPAQKELSGTRMLSPRGKNVTGAFRSSRLIKGIAALVIGLLGVVLYFNTGEGEVVLTVNVDNATVKVDGQVREFRVATPRDDITFTVPAGTRRIEVSRDGFETRTRQFRIFRHGQEEWSVELKPQNAVVASTDRGDAGRPGHVRADNTEELQPPTEPLPGLLPTPRPIAGIRRWQLATTVQRDVPLRVAWSPNGGSLALGSSSNDVRIYDPETLKLKHIIPGGCGGGDRRFAWSPDGRWLALCRPNEPSQLWDATSNKLLDLPDIAANGWALCWSANGQQLAINGKIFRIDERGNSRLARNNVGNMLTGIDLHPAGKLLAMCSNLNLVVLTHEGVRHEGFREPAATAHGYWKMAKWNSDGTRLAVAAIAGGPSALFSVDGKLLAQPTKAVALDWNPVDGTLFLLDNRYRKVHVVDGNGNHQRTMEVQFGGNSISLSPCGKRFAVDGHVYAADGNRLGSIPVHRPGLTGFNALRWSESGHRLLVNAGYGGPGGKRLHEIWTIDVDGRSVDSFGPSKGMDDFRYAIWSGDESLFCVGFGTQGSFFQHRNGDRTLLTGESQKIGKPIWNTQHRLLATSESGQGVRLWNEQGDLLHTIPINTGAPTLSFDRKGERLLVHRDQAKVDIVDTTSGETLQTITCSAPPKLTKLNPVYDELFAQVSGTRIEIWATDGQLSRVVEHSQPVIRLSWSPDGEFLLTADTYAWKVWDRNGEVIGRWKGERWTESVYWSPDSRRIASKVYDGSVYVWSHEGVELNSFYLPDVGQLAWHPSGRYLAGGAGNGFIRLIDVETGEQKWITVLFETGKAAVLSASGEVLHGDPEFIANEFRYIVESHDGRLSTVTQSELRDLTGPD